MKCPGQKLHELESSLPGGHPGLLQTLQLHTAETAVTETSLPCIHLQSSSTLFQWCSAKESHIIKSPAIRRLSGYGCTVSLSVTHMAESLGFWLRYHREVSSLPAPLGDSPWEDLGSVVQ